MMHRIKFLVPVASLFAILLASCKQDFLDTQPLGSVASSATWADGPLSQAFVFNIYSYLGYGGFEEQGLAAYTDEAMFTHAGRNINTFTEGTETESNLAWTSGTYEYGNMYNAIRAANVALTNLPTSTFTDDELRQKLIGESYFLRAYYYQQLVRFYGGVPLVKVAYELNQDYTIARSTYEECVNSIVSDLDSAALLLDGKSMEPGRASKAAALALKSRVLLYAASDLHDATTAKAKSSLLAAYPHIELLAYTGGDRTARWQAAKAATEAALALTSGYKMDLAAPVSAAEGMQNYVSLSMGGGSAVGDKSAAVELIFQRTANKLYSPEDNWPLGGLHYGINNGPNGYHCWAGNTPIQQLVDDYEMMDGSRFDWGNAEQKSHPYANRDPRFYASVLYDGADWKPRPADVADKDPANQIQTGYYDNGSGGLINGLDTRESPIENWNGSRTHYYTRKFIDPNPALPDNQSNAQLVPWPFIRYTELAFNYVECCLALGLEDEARTWLNKIRFRSGMPAITDAGAALLKRYQNERRIELSYEEHRYHDARRWLIAPETLGRPVKQINVTAKLKPGKSPLVPYRHDESVYTYTYEVVNNTENEKRVWVDKMYYRPISRTEISKNEKLSGFNNPGYE